VAERQLADYLAVIRPAGRDDPPPELRHGQFHDVVLAGDVAYRFPRDEESRRALPGRVALLRVLAGGRLPVAIPAPLTAADPGQDEPRGRSHVALSRLPGQPLPREQATSPRSEPIVIGQLGRLLDALAGLGAEPAVRKAVPGLDPTIGDARAIAATFALQQALPAALSGDHAMLADGLAGYAG
jgi:hypothetical protein